MKRFSWLKLKFINRTRSSKAGKRITKGSLSHTKWESKKKLKKKIKDNRKWLKILNYICNNNNKKRRSVGVLRAGSLKWRFRLWLLNPQPVTIQRVELKWRIEVKQTWVATETITRVIRVLHWVKVFRFQSRILCLNRIPALTISCREWQQFLHKYSVRNNESRRIRRLTSMDIRCSMRIIIIIAFEVAAVAEVAVEWMQLILWNWVDN